CHIFWLAINPNTLARGFLHRPPLSALVMTNRDLPHQSNIVIETCFSNARHSLIVAISSYDEE
ncbi:MAG: hypothetical protein J0L94_15490, partial [Rhodothermia bacterium]|nr:hypothetical protein [Rhodothermia bacterium]